MPCRTPGSLTVVTSAFLAGALAVTFNLARADDTTTSPAPASPSLAGSSEEDWRSLDWRLSDALTPEQRKQLPVACCGMFIEPAAPANSADPALLLNNNDIAISGNKSVLTRDSTLMTGDVVLTQGQRRITGSRAEVFNQPQGVTLEGNVLFREPGFLLQGSDAKLNLEDNTLEVHHARYVLHQQHVHGTASEIRRDAQGVISLSDSSYSSCTPGDELWFLKSSSMELDPANGQGRATHVRLEVMDTPVFYFPYLMFPVGDQRHSGFLAPSFASGDNGVEMALPYYFNLAPNYDATLIPRYLAERGNQIGGEFRHLSPSFETAASATWLSHDAITGENRWLAGLEQEGGKQQPWSTQIDFTRVSDRDYFDDLDNVGLSVSRAKDLRGYASAGYMSEHWDSTLTTLAYQSLRLDPRDDQYQKLPEFSTTGTYALGQGFTAELDHRATRFDHRDTTRVTGDRFAVDYQLSWRSGWQATYVSPSIDVHYLEQRLKQPLAIPASDATPSVAIPGASLDTGMFFERDHGAYHQTLEPRLHYRYVAYQNQDDFELFDTDEMTLGYSQLFRDNRFSGADRIGDANQVAAGLTSRWVSNDSGNEWLQLGIGQIYYGEDRRISAYTPATYALLPAAYQQRDTRARSPLLSGLQWGFRPHWHLAGELAWDEESRRTDNGNVFLHYRGEDNTLFSAGYRYVQLLQWTGTAYTLDTARQSDFSTYWPFSNQWGLTARSLFDFTHHRQLESLAGVQYEDCCWRLRTVYRRWSTNPDETLNVALQPLETGVYVEIQFKNLAGVGTQTDDLLNDSIYGYREAYGE